MQDLSKIKIIFSDIDGTLLPFAGKDLKPTAALIRELLEAGYRFIPCTGRGTGNIPQEIKNIPGLSYAVTANGALVTDLRSGQAVWKRMVPRELARKLTLFLRNYNGNAYLYRNGEHHLDVALGEWPYNHENKSLEVWRNTVVQCDFLELLNEPESAFLDKMGFASNDPKQFERILADIPAESYYDELLVTTSADWNIEINAAGASKGDAALWLTKELGLKPENMLCAGDNINDLSMLKAGGISLAPENALPEVKAAVDFVVPDCLEDGVENFLRKLLK
ncbi:MAG: HAD family phosphatase [Lachnospiraceae bacterium]|nr:HAD family phosphatase [Lachnospiraceae bacterium]